MNSEPNPNAQIPAGNVRHAAELALDRELFEDEALMCVLMTAIP
jgi:hypothetical protein